MKKLLVTSILLVIALALAACVGSVVRLGGRSRPYRNVRRVRDLATIQGRLKTAAARSDRMALGTLGSVHYGIFKAPLWRVAVSPKGPAEKRLLLTGGVHGNEPAGAEAMLRFIERLADSPDRYPNFAFDIIPLVNPWGWAHDRRRNQQGRDINRDFASFDAPEARLIRDFVRDKRYDLVVDHHEHPGASGFYLYQIDCDDNALSRRVIAQQRERGYPIEQDVRMVVFKTRDGLMRIPGWALPLAKLARMLSMTNYLRMQGHSRVFLIETSTTQAWDDRLEMHQGALDVLLHATDVRARPRRVPAWHTGQARPGTPSSGGQPYRHLYRTHR